MSFIPILWGLSKGIAIEWLKFDGSLFWVALATALGGTVLSWFVGIRLPGLEYNNQKTEAALRKELVYAEDDRARMTLAELMQLFMGVRINNFRLFSHYAYFNLWSNLYGQTMIIFPYLLMGPSLFSGIITLGVIQQVGNAFGKVDRFGCQDVPNLFCVACTQIPDSCSCFVAGTSGFNKILWR